MATSLQHPSDPKHSLILRELSENSTVLCPICRLHISGPTYCCWECDIFLHKFCAELPLETRHPDHPHPLALSFPKELCYYRCNACSFCVEVTWKFFIPYTPEEEDEEEKGMIKHVSHDHSLMPFRFNQPIKVECRACELQISGPLPFYGCSVCSFYLHEWCARLPTEIAQHPFHPQHTLTIFLGGFFTCSACETPSACRSEFGLAYKCKECQVLPPFILDAGCATLFLPSEDQQQDCGTIEHFSHHHRLRSISVKVKNTGIRRKACGLKISGQIHGCHEPVLGLAYSTSRNFFDLYREFLCKSCAKLPEELKHPFHPSHPLTLQLQTDLYFDAVGVKIEGFCFGCNECQFFLSVGAASQKPTLKYQPHEHSLTHFERIHASKCCNIWMAKSSVDVGPR